MSKVTKALIPAAGLGTRFLPATKTVPKEMLPIVDKPIILYVVEEAIRAGITDIVLIAGRNKYEIEDFFDCSYELEDQLEKTGKLDVLASIRKIRNSANIISIRQKQALGLGHAVLTGAPIIGKDSFAVLLGDEIMISEPGAATVTEQLSNTFVESGKSTVAVMEVSSQDVKKYGIIAGDELRAGMWSVTNVIEKPEPSEAPSRLALPGRYVFTAGIFEELKTTKPGKNGEIQLTDAMVALAKKEGLIATLFEAKRYDAGDKLGYLQANIELGLKHPELAEKFRDYLRGLKV